MKVGVLRTGHPPASVAGAFGSYPDMFMNLIGRDRFDWQVFAADERQFPETPEACDAYIITGSAAGVYESDPWIGDLMTFLQAARGRARLVGVCFGHQAMAQAFGGQVIKSPKGWGVGAHEYAVLSREPWMDDAATIRLPASHQDQVTGLPPGAEVMAGSEFTPMGALVWRDQPAISIQLHPEFEPDYAKALIETRRGRVYADDQADAAIASYVGDDDRGRVGGWIRRFLEG